MSEKKVIKDFFAGTPSFLPGVLILFVIFNFNIITTFFTREAGFKEGAVVSETIKSPRTIYFKSQIKTKEAEDRAALKVEKVYKKDSTVKSQQLAKNEDVFKVIDAARLSSKESDISEATNISLESSLFLLNISQEEWDVFKTDSINILGNLQDNEKIKNDETLAKEIIDRYIQAGDSIGLRTAKEELISSLLIPNYIYSKEETQKEIDKIKQEIEPVSLLLVKDEVVASAGKVLSLEDVEKLDALGLGNASIFNIKTYGQLIITLLLSLMSYVYFRHLYKTKTSVCVTCTKAFYVFVVFSVISITAFELIAPLKSIMPYLFPLAAPIMLIAILVNVETAFFSSIILSLLLGGIFSSSIEIMALYLITSLVGIYRIQFVKKIENIFSIGLLLSLFSFLALISFSLYTGNYSLRGSISLLGASLIYGLGSVIIIIGTLLFWGKLFKITTFIELIELENPQQKVLRDLSLEAPGTYHHSILVSNLAQKGAKTIDADVLLASVGGLYHDIGKIINPQYYIENQLSKNIHDEIKDPEKSAEFIKAHIKEGVILGKKERLPKEIMHIIESHHGTSEVFYFLKKAKEISTKIDIDKFKYDGPLPETKEAGIIMLADSIEAKSRAESPKTEKRMKEIIDEIVDLKIDSKQLTHSKLTLDEIDILRDAFLSVLININHKRIKYEKDDK
ncbi:HDIG domain-containing protein [bacterium]|nr:HDIG domain-containing protein [bacterium]